jgi:serine/threonine protein kinase
VLVLSRTERPGFRRRFWRKAQTLARLHGHPSIVTIYDFGVTDDLFYTVMEFIPGQNLHQRLRKPWANSQWIPLSEALELVRQLCLAVDCIHRQGDSLRAEPETILGLLAY